MASLLLFIACLIIQLPTGSNGAAIAANLPNSAFTASSEYSDSCEPHDAKMATTVVSWCAETTDGGDYLRIDLGDNYIIEEIGTKGRNDGDNEWVKKYRLDYKTQSGNWQDYNNNNEISANTGKNTMRRNTLSGYIVARYLKLYPTSWNNWPSMRVEVYGYLQTDSPTRKPTDRPTPNPTDRPTPKPTDRPTPRPTPNPTRNPTDRPTRNPTDKPTAAPTNNPTPAPTNIPTTSPSHHPTISPTHNPTLSPTYPTQQPTNSPTQPTKIPTQNPSLRPTKSPTNNPTQHPSNIPTKLPSLNPSNAPTQESDSPTVSPTRITINPTSQTRQPTLTPTMLTNIPTQPTSGPTQPTHSPVREGGISDMLVTISATDDDNNNQLSETADVKGGQSLWLIIGIGFGVYVCLCMMMLFIKRHRNKHNFKSKTSQKYLSKSDRVQSVSNNMGIIDMTSMSTYSNNARSGEIAIASNNDNVSPVVDGTDQFGANLINLTGANNILMDDIVNDMDNNDNNDYDDDDEVLIQCGGVTAGGMEMDNTPPTNHSDDDDMLMMGGITLGGPDIRQIPDVAMDADQNDHMIASLQTGNVRNANNNNNYNMNEYNDGVFVNNNDNIVMDDDIDPNNDIVIGSLPTGNGGIAVNNINYDIDFNMNNNDNMNDHMITQEGDHATYLCDDSSDDDLIIDINSNTTLQ